MKEIRMTKREIDKHLKEEVYEMGWEKVTPQQMIKQIKARMKQAKKEQMVNLRFTVTGWGSKTIVADICQKVRYAYPKAKIHVEEDGWVFKAYYVNVAGIGEKMAQGIKDYLTTL